VLVRDQLSTLLMKRRKGARRDIRTKRPGEGKKGKGGGAVCQSQRRCEAGRPRSGRVCGQMLSYSLFAYLRSLCRRVGRGCREHRQRSWRWKSYFSDGIMGHLRNRAGSGLRPHGLWIVEGKDGKYQVFSDPI
jgi:hypothetical protein